MYESPIEKVIGQMKTEMAVRFLYDVGIPFSVTEVEEYAVRPRTQADMMKFATQIVIRHIEKEVG